MRPCLRECVHHRKSLDFIHTRQTRATICININIYLTAQEREEARLFQSGRLLDALSSKIL